MMSPYSSVLRTKVWGGLPIALPAMGIFAFLIWRALDLMLRQADQRKAAANFLVVSTLIPVGASAVMGYIAVNELQAACKICIGIYASSAAALIASLLCRRAVLKDAAARAGGSGALVVWLTAASQLFAFVAVPAALYMSQAPDFSRYLGSCGALRETEDSYGIMIELGGDPTSVEAIEIFDPLCPACRAFEERLDASEVQSQLHRKAVLFPLDSTCNWMVSRSLHPGACTVSKAILCADQSADQSSAAAVIDWAFAQQEAILEASKQDPEAAMRMVTAEFPALAACVGSAEVEARLNKSLRFAVRNSIPVLTPQLYVAGVKVCDEDTDLGLDWALARMLELQAAGQLHGEAPPAVPEPKLEKVPSKAKPASKTRSKKDKP